VIEVDTKIAIEILKGAQVYDWVKQHIQSDDDLVRMIQDDFDTLVSMILKKGKSPKN
jgi:hypothetical protein